MSYPSLEKDRKIQSEKYGNMKKYELKGFEIMEYEVLASTNTEAASVAPFREAGRIVVLTYRQSSGRGQAGNSWESSPDSNFSFTVILYPGFFPASEQFAISMAVSLACTDFLGRYAEGICVKWPNDIYAGERKIGGILIEHAVRGSHIAYSLCGIGLNMNQKEFLSDAPNPVSLTNLTGRKYDLRECLPLLLEALGKRMDGISDFYGLKKDYMSLLYRKDVWADWEDAKGSFRAVIEDVDDYGRLVLKDETGRRRIYGFKQVIYR